MDHGIDTYGMGQCGISTSVTFLSPTEGSYEELTLQCISEVATASWSAAGAELHPRPLLAVDR